MRQFLTTCAFALCFHGSIPAQKPQELTPHFARLDKNGDGKLSVEEAGSLGFFKAADTDGDGFVTPSEARDHARTLSRRTGMEGDGAGPVFRWPLPAVEIAEEESPVEFLDTVASDGRPGRAVWRKPKGKGPFPAIVFVHGGLREFPESSLRQHVTDNPVITRFLSAGYAVAMATFRTYEDEVQSRGPIEDVRGVVHALAKVPGVDPRRIALYGGSGGGSIALKLGADPAVRTVVAGEPATVLYTGMLTTGDYDPRLEMMADPERFFTADLRQRTLEKLKKLRAPVLILHSDQHDLKKLNRPLFLPLMRQAGVQVEYREYPGYGHGFYFGGGDDRWGKGADDAIVQAVVRDVSRFLAREMPATTIKGAGDRFGMVGMVAKRKLSEADILLLAKAEATIPQELKSPALVAEKTMLLGLESAPPASRHDPSNIVLHEGTYYVWWMERDQELDAKGKVLRCKLPWRLAFASSKDGKTWSYRGAALPDGEPGEWDDMGFAAPFGVPHEGKYYLFYNPTGTTYPEPVAYPGKGWRGLSYAVADSPEGPWQKHDKPVLSPGKKGEWDALLVADVNIIRFGNKWWLYYKGVGIDPKTGARRPAIDVGVAVADELTGSYEKHPLNPVFNGHAFSAWVHRDGVAAQDGGKVFWSNDGARFVRIREAKLPLFSNGWHMPDSFTGAPNPNGVTWGIASRRNSSLFREGGAVLDNWELYQYECKLWPAITQGSTP